MISKEEKEKLLLGYEPILRFYKGERFLPIPVEPYLASCRLMKRGRWFSTDITDEWMPQKDNDSQSINAAAERLSKYGADHYLQFVSAREISLHFWGYLIALFVFLLLWVWAAVFSWDVQLVVVLTAIGLWYGRVNQAALKKIFSVFLIYSLGLSLIKVIEANIVPLLSPSTWVLGIVIFCGATIFMIYLAGFGRKLENFPDKKDTSEQKRELARMHISTRFIFGVLTSGVMISLSAYSSNPIIGGVLLLTAASLLIVHIFSFLGFILGLVSVFWGIPPDSVVCADQKYQKIRNQLSRSTGLSHKYYGRVLEEEKYIVIQYFYFYAFNDWRTAANGINQHEADWEMAAIYIDKEKYETGEMPDPEYVALSAHVGGNKRKWDNVEKDGRHPVIYAAKGSHANYFKPGERPILVEASKNKNALLASFLQGAHVSFRQGVQGYYIQVNNRIKAMLSTKFPSGIPLGGSAPIYNPRYDDQITLTDFADGKGRKLGYSAKEEKDKFAYCLLEDECLPGWVNFKGAWGMDSIPGEVGPPGPRWEGENRERQRWAQPTAWLENLLEDWEETPAWPMRP